MWIVSRTSIPTPPPPPKKNNKTKKIKIENNMDKNQFHFTSCASNVAWKYHLLFQIFYFSIKCSPCSTKAMKGKSIIALLKVKAELYDCFKTKTANWHYNAYNMYSGDHFISWEGLRLWLFFLLSCSYPHAQSWSYLLVVDILEVAKEHLPDFCFKFRAIRYYN